MNPLLGIIIFSAVETLTVIAWFVVLQSNNILAATILFAGYVVEHVLAWNLAKGRPLFSWPRR